MYLINLVISPLVIINTACMQIIQINEIKIIIKLSRESQAYSVDDRTYQYFNCYFYVILWFECDVNGFGSIVPDKPTWMYHILEQKRTKDAI